VASGELKQYWKALSGMLLSFFVMVI